MRIEEEYVRIGYFWLPGKDDEKIPGTLTISDGGDIELEIVGLFGKGIESLSDEADLSRIIGHIEKDGFVTLDDCFYTKRNISFGGISKSKVCVNRALSGVAYDKDEDVTFNSFSFSVDCFDEWVGISGISVKHDWDSKTALISYKPPENIAYYLDSGMRLDICFSYTLPGGGSNAPEVKITQQAYFKLTSEVLRPINEFTEVAYRLTNLMCFAIDATVALKNVWATSSEIQTKAGEDKMRPVPVKIYYSSVPFSEKVPKKSWHQMLFSYAVIKSNAQDVFNNWLKAYDVILPALSLYFSTKTGAQKYLDGKFLALAQGLETYHRRTSDEKLMGSEEFESLISTIIKNCPDDHLSWLNGRLKHGNEISLRIRLKRIIEPFKELLGNSSVRSKLLSKIVDTRNYLTHYNEELKESAADGMELWTLCQKMEVIFQLHFLKVIGFSDQEINNVVENCHPLKRKISEI